MDKIATMSSIFAKPYGSIIFPPIWANEKRCPTYEVIMGYDKKTIGDYTYNISIQKSYSNNQLVPENDISFSRTYGTTYTGCLLLEMSNKTGTKSIEFTKFEIRKDNVNGTILETFETTLVVPAGNTSGLMLTNSFSANVQRLYITCWSTDRQDYFSSGGTSTYDSSLTPLAGWKFSCTVNAYS